MKNKNLTIIVPALNEEKNLNKTVCDLIEISNQLLSEYEILIFDDGSTDQTQNIAKKLEKKYSVVTLIINKKPQELANIFKQGIKMAKFENIILIPGDGAFHNDSIKNVFHSIGLKDMVLTSRINQNKTRSWLRLLITKAFIATNKKLFNLNVDDINSIAVFPTAQLKSIDIVSFNKGFNLEFLVKLTRKKLSYTIIDVKLTPEKHIIGKSLNFHFLFDVILLILRLKFIDKN